MSLPPYWAEAGAQLSAADPVLKSLIAQFPEDGPRQRGDAFQTLARSLIGQQVSVKAAESITNRVWALMDHDVTPASMATLSFEDMRAAGLSRQKIAYLQGAAQAFASGEVHPHRWPDMSDDEVMAELVALKGVGRWTAEMYLMFHLQRPDVLPLADIGLQKAVARQYHDGVRHPADVLHALGETWRPFRSVATWYLWRSLDPVAVCY